MVTNFTDHHDIRCLTQDGAQCCREVQTHRTVHLHLVNTTHLVFHRVFHRNQLLVRTVNLPQASVKRRRLTGTRRTRHENHTVRQTDQAFELRLVIREEAQLRQAEREVLLIENTHHDRLTKVRRHRAHTKVEFAFGHLNLNTTVLRNTTFRKVHICHQLHTRNNGTLQTLRRFVHLTQRAVNTETHAEMFFHRLQVNIGCLHLTSIHQDQRYQTNHRGIAILRTIHLHLLTLRDKIIARVSRIRIKGQRIELIQQPLNVTRGDHHKVRILAVQTVTDSILRIIVRRIANCDHHRITIILQRHRLKLARRLGIQQLCQLWIGLITIHRSKRHPKLFCQSGQDILLRKRTLFHNPIQSSLPVLTFCRQCIMHHLRGYEPGFLQYLQSIFVICSHASDLQRLQSIISKIAQITPLPQHMLHEKHTFLNKTPAFCKPSTPPPHLKCAPHLCRSFIEMIPKMRVFCKLDEARTRAKTADFGVKTQAISRLKVSYFERQSNLS